MDRSWLWPVMALAVPIAAATPVRAQQASFDCLQAQQPIEALICSDPQLIELDGALGAAFVAYRQRLAAKQREAALDEQRAWLAERLSRCGVPAKGGDVAERCAGGRHLASTRCTAPDSPRWARRIRRRRRRPPSPRSPASSTRPACGASSSRTEPSADAEGGASAHPARRLRPRQPPHAVHRGGARGLSAQGASDGYPTWLSYRIVGTLPDGREVAIVWYNAGGSGQFSELYLLRRTPAPIKADVLLTGELIAGGGDRCNGGIEEARLVEPATLEIDYAVTPLDLLSEADEELADANMDSLALCAVCCTGTVRRRLAIDGKTRDDACRPPSTGCSAARPATPTAEPAQTCFDDILGKAAGTLPHTFPAAELKAIAQRFAKTCAPAGNGGRPSR